MSKGAATTPPNAIIGFPPVILCFAHNASRQSLGMVYYIHKEEEHYRGLRIHCIDRRCHRDNDALESFDQVHSRLTLDNPHMLVLVEDNIAPRTLSRITAAVGDNVKRLPLKAFELRDSELLGEFSKPPRDWDVGHVTEWKEETQEKKFFIQFGNERPDIARTALALVKYLRTRYADIATLLKLDTRDNKCNIDFQFSSLDNVVCIDRNTLYALNIFQTDEHPSTVRPHGRAKEGFSLNSFLECFVASAGGRKLLREWCLQPTRDLGELRMRQQSVRALLTSNLREMAIATRQCIASWKSPVSLWASLSLNVNFDNLADWKKFMHEQEKLVEILRKFEKLDHEGLSCVQGIGKARQPLKKSLVFMEMLLDFDDLEHIDESLVRLKSEVDPVLAKSRETYSHVSRYLNGMGILDKKYDFESRGHFLPSYGFCVSLGPNDEPPTDFALKFHLNGRVFYKTKYCTVIDSRLGGLYLEIRTREIQLLKAMVQHLRPVYDFWLEIVSQVFDQFDVLTGFALCSAQYNWTRPVFVEKPLSHIEDGTHPLVEHILDTDLSKEGIQRTFVPNDTFLGGKQPQIQVITGANCSGKSVYLKQVGLIHFLAHIGSFVPAKESHIGVADMIFSRIRTLESASVQLSAFEIDVAQMSRMLQSATENSLILVDEFGKGTRPDDGAALLAACIMRLADRAPLPPRCIFTTHYPEIFTLNLVKHPLVQSFYMNTEKSGQNDTGTKAMEYLYKLKPGFCTRSYGIECAQLAGIPNDILFRASDIYKHLESGDGIPTFEVQALRLLRGFDWENGDRMDLVKQMRATLQGKRAAALDSAHETAVACSASPSAAAGGHTAFGTAPDLRDSPRFADLSRRVDSRDARALLPSAGVEELRASAASSSLSVNMAQNHPGFHLEGVQRTAESMRKWDERCVHGVTAASKSIKERIHHGAEPCGGARESPRRHLESVQGTAAIQRGPQDPETPPEYRNGLDTRGATMHCGAAARGLPSPVRSRARVRERSNDGGRLSETVEKHYEIIRSPQERVDEDIDVLVNYCDTQNGVKHVAPCDTVRDAGAMRLHDHTQHDYGYAEPQRNALYDSADARSLPIERDSRHARPYYQTARHPKKTQAQHALQECTNARPHHNTLRESGHVKNQPSEHDTHHTHKHDEIWRDAESMQHQPWQSDIKNTYQYEMRSDSPPNAPWQQNTTDHIDHTNHRPRVHASRHAESHHRYSSPPRHADDVRELEYSNARPAHHRRADNGERRLRHDALGRPTGHSRDRYPHATFVSDGHHARQSIIAGSSPVLDAHSTMNSPVPSDVGAAQWHTSKDGNTDYHNRRPREFPPRRDARGYHDAKRRCVSTSPKNTAHIPQAKVKR